METWFKPKPSPSQDWENNRKVDGVALIIICDSNIENCSKLRFDNNFLSCLDYQTWVCSLGPSPENQNWTKGRSPTISATPSASDRMVGF